MSARARSRASRPPLPPPWIPETACRGPATQELQPWGDPFPSAQKTGTRERTVGRQPGSPEQTLILFGTPREEAHGDSSHDVQGQGWPLGKPGALNVLSISWGVAGDVLGTVSLPASRPVVLLSTGYLGQAPGSRALTEGT